MSLATSDNDRSCPKCGALMERGSLRPCNLPPLLEEVEIDFVVPGVKTSSNPVTAFQQGLHEAPENRVYN